MLNLEGINFQTEFGTPNDVETFNTGLSLNAAKKPTLPLIWYRDANNLPDFVLKDGKAPSKHTKWFVQWTEFQNRHMDALEFRDYWSKGCNTIALVTGRYSRIWHADLDFRAKENIVPYLQGIALYVDNDQIHVEQSVSGGYKVYFELAAGERWEEDELHNEKLAYAKDNPKVMIESRGQGGCSFIAPSLGYRVVAGFAPSLDKIRPVTRDTLDKCIDVARSFNEDPERIKADKDSKKKQKKSKLKLTPEQQTADANTPIGLFNLRSGYTYTFLDNRGYEFFKDAADGSAHYTRPGKSDGTSVTVKEFDGVPLLRNFSTSDMLLEAEQAYAPFQLFMIDKGLTMKEAVKAICKMGYAPPTKADTALEELSKIVQLDRTEEGHIKSNYNNAVNLLRYWKPLTSLAANDLRYGRLEFFEPFQGYKGVFTDETFSILKLYFETELGLYFDDSILRHALNVIAIERRRNPFIERIKTFVWDHVERCKTFFHDAFNLPQNPLTEESFIKALAGMFARNESDEPIEICWHNDLIGAQRVGKTSFLRNLMMWIHPEEKEEWYLSMDMPTFCDPKRRMETSEGAVCVCIDDLKNCKKADIESFKSELSNPRSMVRAAYGHYSKEIVQKFVLFANGNDDKFLRDPTGNRRFVVHLIPLKERECIMYKNGVFNKYIAEQLMAEAYEWYKKNYHSPRDLELSDEAQDIADQNAEDAFNVSPWEPSVREYIEFRRKGPGNSYDVKVDKENKRVTLDEHLTDNFFNTGDVYKYLSGADDFSIVKMQPKDQEAIRGILTRIKEVEQTRNKNRRGYRVVPKHMEFTFSDYKSPAEESGLQQLLERWDKRESDKDSISINRYYGWSGFYPLYPKQPEYEEDEE